MEIKISNVRHDEFEGVNSISIQYDYKKINKKMFGTLNIDDYNDDKEFRISDVHMGYTLYDSDFKNVVDYINNIISGKKLDEVLKTLEGF